MNSHPILCLGKITFLGTVKKIYFSIYCPPIFGFIYFQSVGRVFPCFIYVINGLSSHHWNERGSFVYHLCLWALRTWWELPLSPPFLFRLSNQQHFIKFGCCTCGLQSGVVWRWAQSTCVGYVCSKSKKDAFMF